MTPMIITVVLTVLAAVAIVLTRVRLGKRDADAAGRLSIPRGLINLHTGAGVPALVVWVAYLVDDNGWLAFAALVLWWLAVIAGLLILARWLPARGQHSSDPVTDSWGDGPGLSVLAHLGLAVGVTVFTTFVVLGKV